MIATAIIWTALACIVIFADVDITSNFISLFVLAGAALLSTAAVWDSAKFTSKAEHAALGSEASEKAKRSEENRLARLIDSLSEEDISTLETVLTARRDQLDEDAQIELNRLLADQEHTRR
jgi:hypothetical protein